MSSFLTEDDITLNKIQNLTLQSASSTINKTVVPTRIPSETVKMIDVTNLSTEKQQQMEIYVQQYAEYINRHLSTAFQFEDFVDATFNNNIKPEWLEVTKI